MELNLIFFIFFLIISFYFLFKSADYLIESSSIFGKRLGISPFIIGVTILAIGTSLPELFTSLFGVIDGTNKAAFVMGTVIGSNIANILLVFSTLLFFSKKFEVKIKSFDLIYFLLSTFSIFILVFFGILNFYLSIILSLLFFSYLFIIIKNSKKKEVKEEFLQEAKEILETPLNKKSNLFLFIVFLVSLIFLNLSAKGIVYNIEKIGFILKIPLEFLTFTTIAFATSLPELVVTYQCAKKREFDLAIGNIIGSNISNVFLILGIIGLIKDILIDFKIYIFSSIILILATILFLFFIYNIKIKKFQKEISIFYFLIYISYVYFLF
jgi:cation:H+ antiporter